MDGSFSNPIKKWSGAKLVLTLHDYSFVCAKKNLMYKNEQCDGPKFQKCLQCSIKHYGLPKGIVTLLAKRIMDPAVRNNVDMVLPVSRAVAIGNNLINSKQPFQIIPNFIPDNICLHQDVSDTFTSQLPKTPYILFVGSLTPHKGINVLLRTYSNLYRSSSPSAYWSYLAKHAK